MRRPPLGVWLYGERIAEIVPRGRGYDIALRYSDVARERWPGNSPLLSCSLPLGRLPLHATPFFRGLFPEGQHLLYLAAQVNVSSHDIYGLLARYGRDVAGAVVVANDDPELRHGDAIPYDNESLAEEVAGLEERPLALYDDSELSLPGLQNKLLLIRTNDGWARPTDGRPSTHILKTEDRRYPGLVAMEHAAMSLARRLELTSAQTEVVTLGGINCIIVSRFDRTTDGSGRTSRVHQEDLCQAMGMNPQTKYESHGGPRLAQLAELLDRHSAQPEHELTRLVSAVVFHVIIGNAVAHAKNMSLLHTAPGVVSLAPLYDTVPTVLWPKLPDRAALFVNGVTTLSRISIRDVVEEAKRWPLDPALAQRTAEHVVTCVLEEIDVIPDRFAEVVSARARAFLASK
jgi:serine/threonine-protein kinase HipA